MSRHLNRLVSRLLLLVALVDEFLGHMCLWGRTCVTNMTHRASMTTVATMHHSRASMHSRTTMASRTSIHSRANMTGGAHMTRRAAMHHSRASMHCRTSMHRRADLTSWARMASGAGLDVSGIGWCRMTTAACIGTSVAALSIARASKVASLTAVTTTHASRATMTIGSVSLSGRRRATPLVREATMACRTSIASAKTTGATVLTMIWTSVVLVDNVARTLVRHGLTDCAN